MVKLSEEAKKMLDDIHELDDFKTKMQIDAMKKANEEMDKKVLDILKRGTTK